MNTKIYTKTLLVWLLMALIFSGCEGKKSPVEQTAIAVRELARVNADGSITLEGSTTLADLAPMAVALNETLEARTASAALMYFRDADHIAFFVTTGQRGAMFLTAIDTNCTAIVDASAKLEQFGINLDNVHSLTQLERLLKDNKFEELTTEQIPTVIATLRLAIAWMKSQGGRVVAGIGGAGATISDILAVPAWSLSPENLYPFDISEGVQR